MDARDYPEPPAAGPRLRRLDRARARSPRGRHARPDPAGRPRPLKRLRHRRPRRPRLRRRRPRPARRSKKLAPPARPPEQLLLEQGAIDADQLSRAVAERYGLDHVDLAVYQVDMAAANLIPVNTARRYRALPVGFVDKETLLVAMADPTNVLAVDDIQIATGTRLPRRRRRRGGHRGADRPPQHPAERRQRGRHRGRGRARTSWPRSATCEVSAEDAPVIKLVYSILGQAVGEGASDVHFEPDEDEMRVRFRIDGVLREAAHVPKRMVNAVVSRIKIMSDLNIAEKRVPQDGRVSVTVEDRRVDLRITTLPTQRGEGATIRILDKDNAQRSLDELGMDGSGARALRGRLPPGLRRRPRHRPDRLGQVDDALRGAPGAERRREEHHHDRGPGRVPARRDQPDQRQPRGRASTSPPACARSCAPTPTSSWSARSATARRRGSRSRRR